MALKPHSFIAEIRNNPFVEKNSHERIMSKLIGIAFVICLGTMLLAFIQTIDKVYDLNNNIAVTRIL